MDLRRGGGYLSGSDFGGVFHSSDVPQSLQGHVILVGHCNLVSVSFENRDDGGGAYSPPVSNGRFFLEFLRTCISLAKGKTAPR